MNPWWQAITVAGPLIVFMAIMWWRTRRVRRIDVRVMLQEERIKALEDFRREIEELKKENPYLFERRHGLRVHGQ